MEDLVSNPKILICGPNNSGKTRKIFEIVTSTLENNPGTNCLIFTSKHKFLVKKPFIKNEENIKDRIFFKFFDSRAELLSYFVDRSIFHIKPLSIVVVEDIDTILYEAYRLRFYALITAIASSNLPDAAFLVTSTPEAYEKISNYRYFFDFYELYSDNKFERFRFHLNIKQNIRTIMDK